MTEETLQNNGDVTLGGNHFHIEKISDTYYIAVPEDPAWLLKWCHETCERDAADRATKKK